MLPDAAFLECLNQRLVLLNTLRDLTKQMEVRCLESDPFLDDLLQKRSVYLERLRKCEVLLNGMAARMPEDCREPVRSALRPEGEISPLCPPEVRNSAEECRRVRERILALDASVRNLILARCREVKARLDEFPK